MGQPTGRIQGLPPSFSLTPDQLGALMAHVSDIVASFDETGAILFISPAVRTFLGYEPADLIGRNVTDLMHPDDLDEFAARWGLAVAKSGPTQQPSYRVLHANGSWVPMTVDFYSGEELGPVGAGVATVGPLDRTTQVERDLRKRLINEDRLVALASTFVNLPTDQFDEGVEATLYQLASLRAIARVSVFRRHGDQVVMTHQWAAFGSRMSVDDVPPLAIAESRYLTTLARMEEVFIDVDADEHADGPMVESLRAEGLKGVLSVPMAERGEFAGFVSFSSREAGPLREGTYVSMLRSAASILGEAFARNRAERRLAYQARIDVLTGLANRWAFMEALSGAVERLQQGTLSGFSVLLLDLDRFKVVNDSLGHHAGDKLLSAVAARLAEAAGPSELVARFGGDEIIVLLEERGCPASARERADALLSSLSDPFELGTHEFSVTASGGLAVADPGLDPEELLRRADAAMFEAKERGRRRVEVFDDVLRERVNVRLRQESELQRAVREDQLRLYYQPEVDLETGLVVSAEALVRWDHPERGIVVAAEFIDIAEETGSILEIGGWALAEACRQLGDWQARGLDLTMRVNLSARQVNQPDLVERLVDAIEGSHVDPSGLCLEITETAVMADAELSLEVLSKLAGLGITLAIDDFGTGYSSLEYLKRFPVHVLKVDRSFVLGVASDPDDVAIVEAVLSLARALGLDVTAEGVETTEQRTALLAMGFRRAQGFLFSPAVPVADLEAMVGRPLPAD